MEHVEEFVYLGATVTRGDGGTENIKKRPKARHEELFQPAEDLENTENWSEHEHQTVQDVGAGSTTGRTLSLENNNNGRKEAG